jgi:hypothetical protein
VCYDGLLAQTFSSFEDQPSSLSGLISISFGHPASYFQSPALCGTCVCARGDLSLVHSAEDPLLQSSASRSTFLTFLCSVIYALARGPKTLFGVVECKQMQILLWVQKKIVEFRKIVAENILYVNGLIIIKHTN